MTKLAAALTLMFFSLAPAMPARAADAPPEARALIERQLDAFANGDANAAYAIAAPGIQKMFRDAEFFMAMVKTQYAPVYRHRSVEFGPSALIDDAVEQSVTLVDPDNVVWKALYHLSRQGDGSWRIEGCVLARSDDASL